MLLEVINIKHISDYILEIYFNNNSKKIVDLKETIFNDKRDVFEDLKTIEYFKTLKLN